MGFRQSRTPGFTLVELLVVIAIMLILTAAAVPSIMSLTSAGKMNQATSEIIGILEEARQYAAAQNTYVWVAFSPQVANNIDQLSVATVASTDGTDPGVYGTAPSSNFMLITKVRTFPQVELKNAGTFTSSQMTSLNNLESTGSANALSTTTTFNIVPPGSGSALTFGQSLEFTPSGEARNGSSPIDIIEFDLEPANTISNPNPKNPAVFRINGVTGQTIIYRM